MTNTNIKLAVTNLGQYNEGTLNFEWLTLPATTEEIEAVMKNIGIDGVRYEEHFISDYEAPFSIGEYDSIERLNEIAELLEDVEIPELQGLSVYKYYEVCDVIQFAHDLESNGLISDAMEYVGDIVDDEQLDEMVEFQAKDGGWARVKFFLAGIDNVGDEYFYINGYGNAERLSHDTLNAIVSDLYDEMTSNI